MCVQSECQLNLYIYLPKPNNPKEAVAIGERAVTVAAKISADPPATTGNDTKNT